MKKILVLCTGNSCRSQMAEGYLAYFAGDRTRIFSAGIEKHGVNPLAVAAMKADGVDISRQTSNHVSEYAHIAFDYVITVCDHASKSCPAFPSDAVRVHQNFPDPAKATGSENEIADEFARVRNQIKTFCKEFLQAHNL